jgi:formiminoglutamase
VKLLDAPPFEFRAGHLPLLVSMPHVGTHLPRSFQGRLTPECAPLGDTDWHLPQLYDFVFAMQASTIVATYSRFVVDLNRPPDDRPLYVGATTGLHPDILFDGRPAFREGCGLTGEEKATFMEGVWHPYHAQVASELARLRGIHGRVLLFDAHSIAGVIPRLFEGELPDFNLGTADGMSASAALTHRLAAALASPRYRLAVNGRFKGGYITRHYGRPGDHVEAVQLEIAQRTYMRESPPYDYLPERAAHVRPVLQSFVEHLVDYSGSQLGV